MLTPGRWYTPQDLANLCGHPLLLRESGEAVEKRVKKWRYEVQE
jgi:hypothetical protein